MQGCSRRWRVCRGGALFYLLLAILVAPNAIAQSWNYKAYNNSGENTANGYITLKQTPDGKAQFRMFAGRLDTCMDGVVDAEVAKTEATTVITVGPRLSGCPTLRFVVKNDGTGGHREVLQGENWVRDRFERDLTLRR